MEQDHVRLIKPPRADKVFWQSNDFLPNQATKDTMNILAISGSTRQASTNTALLQTMKSLAPRGVKISVFHSLHDLPIFSPDLEEDKTPQAVKEFIAAISTNDAMIISSPEYIRTIPGGLKNAIDWLVSRYEVIEKPIVLVHASHRGDEMLACLRQVLSTVSSNFLENLFLRIPLLGKSPQEVADILSIPEHEQNIRSFLLRFVDAIHEGRG